MASFRRTVALFPRDNPSVAIEEAVITVPAYFGELFVNLYSPTTTLAITGPWEHLRG